MSEFELEGVFPALITPFKEDESIDEEAYRTLIRRVLPHVAGIVPCGTTGEFVYLSVDERKRLYDIAVEEAKMKGKYVIAGTGSCATKHAVELTRYAERAGADAALIVSPYYLDPTDKGQYEHFYRTAESTDLPIVMYNIPQCTGAPLSVRVIEDLARIDNIVGLKDSSGDLTYTMEVLEKARDGINVVIGHDEVVMPALSGGCKGMILASAQVFPEIWRKVYNAVKKGDLGSARTYQMKVQKLARIFCRYGGAVPVKAALRMLGLKVGKARRPLKEGGVILHEDLEEIRVELAKLGKIDLPDRDLQPREEDLYSRFGDLGLAEEIIRATASLRAGEGDAGSGVDRVGADLLMGPKDSPAGKAFAVQLTHPRHGHEALNTILEPNLSVRPSTLMIPAVALKNLRQANMIYGPVQNAAAKVIADNLERGVIDEEESDTHVLLLKVRVHPNALDRPRLFRNSYKAIDTALKTALSAPESAGGGE